MSDRTQQFEIRQQCPGFQQFGPGFQQFDQAATAKLPAAVWVYADRPLRCAHCDKPSFAIADSTVQFSDGSQGFIDRPLSVELAFPNSVPGVCLSMGDLIE